MALKGANRTSIASREEEDTSEEYESRRVPDEALQANWSFATIFAGRHTAAPELVIGPQFVLGGATFTNMVIGCLVGNVLAVLSWRYVCAPIGVEKRFSTYETVKRICGNKILAIYNVLVALALGGIAGIMFILATSAVGILFDLKQDSDSFIVSSIGLALLTIVTGAATTVVAMFGFNIVTVVSYWLTPPMFVIIGYLLYASCADLGITMGNLFNKLDTVVFTGKYVDDSSRIQMSFVAIMLSAWVQDQFCHIGCIDLTMFRFAKDANAGWQSAWGMYLGHFVLWIGAGVMFRSQEQATKSDAIDPGAMAYRLAGIWGLLAILFASWSTANPFLYAGGLGLKSTLSIFGVDASSRVVTGVMGVVATICALFPGIVNYFLPFLQNAGAFLVPLGAIIVVDTYVLPKMGKQSDWSFSRSEDCSATNIPAFVAWIVGVGVVMVLVVFGGMPPYFGPLIGFPLTSGTYAGLAKSMLPDASAASTTIEDPHLDAAA